MSTHSLILDALIQIYTNQQPINRYFCEMELCDLSNDASDEIRMWLAKALVYCDDEHIAVPLLSRLTKDGDSLVRLEATDSLSAFVSHESFCVLLAMLDDENDLIRAYAAFGIALVGSQISPQKATDILHKIANTETNKRVLVDTYEGLYILGHDHYLLKLFSLFKEEDYQIQIAVLHALEEVTHPGNYQTILQFIHGLDLKGRSRAVLNAISNWGESIGNYS